jgi:glycosyltransferase involved in cell wall biosynthesis
MLIFFLKLLQRPTLIIYDDLDFRPALTKSRIGRRIVWILELIAIRSSDLVLSVCNVLAQYRISEGARRVFVVPNGVDDSFFKSNLKDRIPSKLIYIGYVDLDRGVDIPIYCLRQLSQKIKGIKYIIVGDGPAITSLQLLSKELKVSSMIEFYGVVSRNNIPQIPSKCGIGLALYSKRSHAIWGSSLKVLEYMASGLPVIVSPYFECK